MSRIEEDFCKIWIVFKCLWFFVGILQKFRDADEILPQRSHILINSQAPTENLQDIFWKWCEHLCLKLDHFNVASGNSIHRLHAAGRTQLGALSWLWDDRYADFGPRRIPVWPSPFFCGGSRDVQSRGIFRKKAWKKDRIPALFSSRRGFWNWI